MYLFQHLFSSFILISDNIFEFQRSLAKIATRFHETSRHHQSLSSSRSDIQQSTKSFLQSNAIPTLFLLLNVSLSI